MVYISYILESNVSPSLYTQLVDMFVEQTHNVRSLMQGRDKPLRFTDTRIDEQQRLISVKMMPMSLVMPSTRGKSYLLNLMDTPGACKKGGVGLYWGAMCLWVITICATTTICACGSSQSYVLPQSYVLVGHHNNATTHTPLW